MRGTGKKTPKAKKADNRPEYEKLAERFIESAASRESVKTSLATSQRIIHRVTDGIYREPWAAFRELVANAYDADSTAVFIETDAPDFEQVTVRDNGNGMSPSALAYMLQNIGGSSKRTGTGAALNTAREGDADVSPGGRPLIGKIGIGIFAVAQLTQHFQIITKAKGERVRQSATVRLQTPNEERFAGSGEDGKDDKYIAGEVTVRTVTVADSEVDKSGTEIVLYTLKPEVRRSLQSVQRWRAASTLGDDGNPVQSEPVFHIGLPKGALTDNDLGKEPNLPWRATNEPDEKFERLFSAVGDMSGKGSVPGTLEHFDEYLRLVWKLSLSMPLNYIDEHPFDFTGGSKVIFFDVPTGIGQANRTSIADNETIRNHFHLTAEKSADGLPFSVLLDGIAISRPIKLPTQIAAENSRIKHPVMMVSSEIAPFKQEDLDRAGGPLSFDAYLYWNSKIVPKDTVGVLIRIRGACGTLFDRTFLNYQVSEQTRLRQITAEIFVKEGLDVAINIDRESFNFSHPHFIYIQKWLHKALRLLVNRLKAIAAEDLEREKAAKHEAARERLRSRAYDVWTRQRGNDADPPLARNELEAMPSEVGGAEIDWVEDEVSEVSPDTAIAVAVVLEAYGVLSGLNSRDRAKLIKDILKIFDKS